MSDNDNGSVSTKESSRLDTFDDAGNLMQTRQRGDVHTKGFWHRFVHVWVVDLTNGAVMMLLRAPSKKVSGGMWSCCTGHIGEAETSQGAAVRSLQQELKLSYPETDLDFMFSCKDSTSSGDLTVKQMIEVYALPLACPPSTYSMGVDQDEATAVRYLSIDDLEEVYNEKAPDHALVINPEYMHRLFRTLRKMVREYHASIPREDSDDETSNWKARQLLDTLDVTGLVQGAGHRGAVHRSEQWHRAVHIWILDLTCGAVLLNQRAARKQHFAGQWHCCSGYIKLGDPSLPAAVKTVKDDLGLIRLRDTGFEFLFQARTETDTGGGCLLKQIVDVFCVTVPSEEYERPPSRETMVLAPEEVDDVRYMYVDELEAVWCKGKTVNPEYVMPCVGDYGERLFFLLKRKCQKYQHELSGGTWPEWSKRAASSGPSTRSF